MCKGHTCYSSVVSSIALTEIEKERNLSFRNFFHTSSHTKEVFLSVFFLRSLETLLFFKYDAHGVCLDVEERKIGFRSLYPFSN